MSFGNNNRNISPAELLLGYPTNVIMAWKERRSIQWKICIPLSALVIAGSIPGILSGLLCGLYGIGALLGAYVSRVTEDSHFAAAFVG